MTIRNDWPKVENGGFDTEFSLPRHPKINGLRSRDNYYRNYVENGIPLSECFYTVFTKVNSLVPGYFVDGQLYYASFVVRDDEEPLPNPLEPIIVEYTGEYVVDPRGRTVVESRGWSYNSLLEEWIDRRYGYVLNPPPNISFGQAMSVYLAFDDSWEPVLRWGMQFIIGEGYRRYQYPDNGPANIPYPPTWDAWWQDQI